MDCREGLQKLGDNMVHSIVTDPPYELGFMGKDWDKTGIVFDIAFWKECLRVLRPGGYLLAFSSCRTYHRVACAIEDAGFEIRDKIDYFYDANQDMVNFINSLSKEQQRALQRIIEEESGVGFLSWIYGQGYPKGLNIGRYIQKQIKQNKLPADCNELAIWDGWNTSLKPANEPICVARKPMKEKTVLENIRKWGTGAFNIDKNRIGTEVIQTMGQRKGVGNSFLKNYKSPEGYVGERHIGRYPANVVLDENASELLDKQSGVLKSGDNCVRTKPGTFLENGGLGKKGDVQITYGDEGGASRFFYCAKASKRERGKYNNHPTVKPISLIKHLVSLVTPTGGISLDPFIGSGTHPIACMDLGVKYIGFEKNEEYFNIAIKRIDDYKKQSAEKQTK